jgi:hypothetical protein
MERAGKRQHIVWQYLRTSKGRRTAIERLHRPAANTLPTKEIPFGGCDTEMVAQSFEYCRLISELADHTPDLRNRRVRSEKFDGAKLQISDHRYAAQQQRCHTY